MKCIELFAGAGGAALGLETAGIEHAALCEWDRDACATMRAAGLGPVVEGDVRDLDAIAAVAGESCDLLWSSWPCQPDSSAGPRLGSDDPRDGWPATLAAVERFRPRWFLGEQVTGSLTNGRNAAAVRGLSARFDHAGHWVLRASDYGVPQDRIRVIIWAGPVPLVPPVPSHGIIGSPRISWGAALGFRSGRIKGAGKTARRNAWRDCSLPCNTITASGTAWIDADGEGRRLTAGESAVIQGFPSGYPFQGTDTKIRRQIGNAVPPKLAEVVARRVVEADKTIA